MSDQFEHDFYAILGVPFDSDRETIRTAFRRLASLHHPDHGGTHEQMVKINLAWEILSDTHKRSKYDEWYLVKNQSERTVAYPVTESDHAHANSYPKTWAAFEKWFDSIACDFDKTTYTDQPVPFWLWPFVGKRTLVASRSVSAYLFNTTTAMIFMLTGYLCLIQLKPVIKTEMQRPLAEMYPTLRNIDPVFSKPAQVTYWESTYLFGKSPWSSQRVYGGRVYEEPQPTGNFWSLIAMFGLSGSIIGSVLHRHTRPVMRAIQQCLNRQRTACQQSFRTEQSQVVRCPSCKQQLRISNRPDASRIVCPKCKTQFE